MAAVRHLYDKIFTLRLSTSPCRCVCLICIVDIFCYVRMSLNTLTVSDAIRILTSKHITVNAFENSTTVRVSVFEITNIIPVRVWFSPKAGIITYKKLCRTTQIALCFGTINKTNQQTTNNYYRFENPPCSTREVNPSRLNEKFFSATLRAID